MNCATRDVYVYRISVDGETSKLFGGIGVVAGPRLLPVAFQIEKDHEKLIGYDKRNLGPTAHGQDHDH